MAHAAATVQALHQSVHLTQVENGLTVDAHTWMGKGGAISDLGQGTGALPQPLVGTQIGEGAPLGPRGQP